MWRSAASRASSSACCYGRAGQRPRSGERWLRPTAPERSCWTTPWLGRRAVGIGAGGSCGGTRRRASVGRCAPSVSGRPGRQVGEDRRSAAGVRRGGTPPDKRRGDCRSRRGAGLDSPPAELTALVRRHADGLTQWETRLADALEVVPGNRPVAVSHPPAADLAASCCVGRPTSAAGQGRAPAAPCDGAARRARPDPRGPRRPATSSGPPFISITWHVSRYGAVPSSAILPAGAPSPRRSQVSSSRANPRRSLRRGRSRAECASRPHLLRSGRPVRTRLAAPGRSASRRQRPGRSRRR